MKQQRNVPFSYYGVSILWLLFIILQPSTGISLKIILSIGIFTLLRLIQTDHASVPCGVADTLISPELDTNHVLQLGDVAIFNLRQVMEQIQNPGVRTTIAQLELLGGEI